MLARNPIRHALLVLTILGIAMAGTASSSAAPPPPPATPLPGDLPIPPQQHAPLTSLPTRPAGPTPASPGFTIAGPFQAAGTFSTRQQAYLDMLTARADLTSIGGNSAPLGRSLAGFQAQRDAMERANLVGMTDSLPALQQRLRALAGPARDTWADLSRGVPGVGLLTNSPLAPPLDAGSRTAPRTPLAANLLAMPSLDEVSGGKAVDPTAFVAGRAGNVDSCRTVITNRIQDTATTGGRPGEPGRCMDTPVGLAYREGPAFDPDRFRRALGELPARPPEVLTQKHKDNQTRAQSPPPPPQLPEELTRSNSGCRRFDNTLDEGASWFPPLGPVSNALEHLCLLAFK
ncbi:MULTISPECIES: hypothetical protein [unclassified Crossiella]|uniref:hypothetical protein n=1 Tax=unclassified Crossiella TaxID=2620835 RepID=UPI001FFED37A|nr:MULTISPECIES: hypothetical protein [unclassified Crossiella]MCK2240917.1 hypothetical protein [Crossiella sp. S99.2]MCK2253939.1 hypothetical protein [Crossiella sp. S99.1]